MAPINLLTVNLGINQIKVPVFEIGQADKEKTLLVTAGMDGDEYASIDAAYRLIEEYSNKKINGKLIIIPIVNIPSFENNVSFNPLDNKYPKWIFPGKENGSPTERLIHWLNENYVSRCHIWIDLHGGGTGEVLNPYIYFYETGNKELSKKITELISIIDTQKIIFKMKRAWNKCERLAKKGIIYIMTEAGYEGSKSKIWVKEHINWVKTVMDYMGLIRYKKRRVNQPRIYRKIYTIRAKSDGLWYPHISKDTIIKKGDMLGAIRSFDSKILNRYVSKYDGEYLWGKISLPVKRSEILLEIGI